MKSLGVRRIAAAAVLVAAMVGGTMAPAEARWFAGFNEKTTEINDIAVCTDHITLSVAIKQDVPDYESDFGALVPEVGDRYPGGAVVIDLYATESEAIARQGAPVTTVAVPTAYVAPGEFTYVFEGQGTVPTPSGFETGDVLYASDFRDERQTHADPAAIVIGGPPRPGIGEEPRDPYECPVDVGELRYGIVTAHDRVWVDSPFPYLIVFDPREVDPSTLRVMADDGAPSDVHYLGSFIGLGFAFVDVGAAGVSCSSEELILLGESSAGPLEGRRSINPIGFGC